MYHSVLVGKERNNLVNHKNLYSIKSNYSQEEEKSIQGVHDTYDLS